jgi:Mg2+ and Co2+ transporter CorA
MHVPVFNSKDQKTYSREIDFILTNNAIVTVTFEHITPLEEFWAIVKKEGSNPHYEREAGHFLYHLINHLFKFSLRELDHIQENINTLEDIMFYGKNDVIARDVYIARRDIIDFRRTLKPQENVLRSLEESGAILYGDAMRPFFRNITSEYLRVWDVLEGHKETIDELYETNESIVYSKINKTMKALAVLAFLTFIPSLIANLFSMSVVTIPLATRPNAFWIIVGLSALLSFGAYWYFKIRKII